MTPDRSKKVRKASKKPDHRPPRLIVYKCPVCQQEVPVDIAERKYEEALERIADLIADNEQMATAIEKALADAETGEGWGPDVTVAGILSEALATHRGGTP